ncbi:MAG: TolC family protein [bacterium]
MKNLIKFNIYVFFAMVCANSVLAQTYLSLNECKNLALTNNVKIKNSKLQVESSKQIKKETFTNYFPTIEADAFAFKSTDNIINMNMLGMPISLLDKTTIAAVTAMQPIFAGGQIINGNKLASLGVDVNNEMLNLAKNEELIRTEEKYWQIVSLTNKLKTLKDYETLLDNLLVQVTDAYNAGLITKNDLLKVMLKKSEIELNKLKLTNGIKLSFMSFCQSIGIEYKTDYVLSDSVLTYNKPENIFEDPNIAVTERGEYRLLQQSVHAEELKSSLVLGELLPTVAVGVNGLYMDLLDHKSTHLLFFGTVRVPISKWWGGTYKLNERSIKEEIARNSAEDNEELLILQVNKVWNELVEADQKILLAEEILKQADENLKVNTDSFKQGIVNVSDLLEAKAIHQQSLENLIDAKSEYRIKYITYQQVTGNYIN